jgi:hypothetical protein
MTMAVKGYLVYVPFENIATMAYGNGEQPDKATVATTPGDLAGPFEVTAVVGSESSGAMFKRRSLDDQLRYMAAKLRDGQPVEHVSIVLDVLADELGTRP